MLRVLLFFLFLSPSFADGNIQVRNDYPFDVCRGRVTGTRCVNKFGQNPSVGATEETIWDLSRPYVYMTTGAPLFVSSSSTSDTTISVRLYGVDSDYNLIQEDIELNGQNPVKTTADNWYRAFRMYNLSGTESVGNVYAYTTGTLSGGVPTDLDTVKAYFSVTHQQTLMSLFTVPKNMKCQCKGMMITVSKNADISVRAVARDVGGVFRTSRTFEAVAGNIPANEDFGRTYGPQTDIEVRSTSSSGAPSVSVIQTLYCERF